MSGNKEAAKQKLRLIVLLMETYGRFRMNNRLDVEAIRTTLLRVRLKIPYKTAPIAKPINLMVFLHGGGEGSGNVFSDPRGKHQILNLLDAWGPGKQIVEERWGQEWMVVSPQNDDSKGLEKSTELIRISSSNKELPRLSIDK